MNKDRLMKIALIGAGNVATHLGKVLKEKGYEVCQVYSRTEQSAAALGTLLDCAYTTSLEDVTAEAELYIVSVKDAVLQDLIPVLVKRNPQALFVHTAGSMPQSVWEGHAVRYGVLYPMQTFSKQRPVDFAEVPFFVEACMADDLHLLKELASTLSPKVYEATSEQRRYLHIAAVFACNFTNHMYAVCAHLLSAQHLPFEAMLPLIDETARKVHHLPPVEAQTGPSCRYDVNVIERHLKMLASEPELAAMYEQISKNIHNYTISKNQKP